MDCCSSLTPDFRDQTSFLVDARIRLDGFVTNPVHVLDR
jgi:hypothetical protein